MARWGDLRSARPDLAEAGQALLYQFSVGLAFLGTVRRDGGPRTHPICPLLANDGLYAFLVPSPKRADLVRDPRYSLHSFPSPQNEDAIYLTGNARRCDDVPIRDALVDQFIAERAEQFEIPRSELDEQQLVEFDVQTCMLTRTTGHGDTHPQHTVWRA